MFYAYAAEFNDVSVEAASKKKHLRRSSLLSKKASIVVEYIERHHGLEEHTWEKY
ncbi:hypothetical protein DPMN_109659 [Dreissena polymorpha]|uniref:Uncharacterized protein n=1 Tax=Dreissena polymorpha TaxID=45954 RepID=A0A9D4KB68_DREPO|nr:hypothetical protein DPMN_109659 [Dreissena polymorpha]